jgi:hypothetical protein
VAAVTVGLLLAGCATGAGAGQAGPEGTQVTSARPPALSDTRLQALLLTAEDLGEDYARRPVPSRSPGEPTGSVKGCRSLERLAREQPLKDLAGEAAIRFVSPSTRHELTEELHSDRPAALSARLREFFDAYTGCRRYTLTSPSLTIDMTVSQVPAPRLGDESRAYLEQLTSFTGPNDFTKTVAVRKGDITVLLRGTPALVDREIGTAVARLPSG